MHSIVRQASKHAQEMVDEPDQRWGDARVILGANMRNAYVENLFANLFACKHVHPRSLERDMLSLANN